MKWYAIKEMIEYALPWAVVFALVAALAIQQERHEETLTRLVLGASVMTPAEINALPICVEGLPNGKTEDDDEQGIPSRADIRESMRSLGIEPNQTTGK